MDLIADILLVAGALGAGLYCFVLARRLKRFTDLEQGVGGAVSVLSTQAEELKTSLESARQASDQSGATLQALTDRAEAVAQRLELMMASMHDVIPQEQDVTDVSGLAADDAAEEEDETHPPASDEPKAEADASDQPIADEKPLKAPEGVMFFRHAQPSGGARQ